MSYKKHLNTLFLAILGGAAIAIGGTVFLAQDNKVVGAVMFAVGLYTICVHGLNLFTGKVGYLVNREPAYLIDLLIIWIGNFIGTAGTAFLMLNTRAAGIAEKAAAMCEIKNNDSLLSLLLLGIYCGVLMYGAVEGYKRCQNPLIIFFCVAVFILAGFEHCIADMFYYAIGGPITANVLLRLIVISLGNAIGGMLIPLAQKFNASVEV